MVPTSPTRELYVQGSQEHQRLGSNPRTGRLKTDALTTGPRESLTRLRGAVGYESSPEGGAVRCEACCALELGMSRRDADLPVGRENRGRQATTACACVCTPLPRGTPQG